MYQNPVRSGNREGRATRNLSQSRHPSLPGASHMFHVLLATPPPFPPPLQNKSGKLAPPGLFFPSFRREEGDWSPCPLVWMSNVYRHSLQPPTLGRSCDSINSSHDARVHSTIQPCVMCIGRSQKPSQPSCRSSNRFKQRRVGCGWTSRPMVGKGYCLVLVSYQGGPL